MRKKFEITNEDRKVILEQYGIKPSQENKQPKKIKITESQLKSIMGSLHSEKEINEQIAGTTSAETGAGKAALSAGVAALSPEQQARIDNIANTYASVKKVGNDWIIQNPNSSLNNTKWVDYLTQYKITPQDVEAAKKTLADRKTAQNTQNQRYQNIANMYSSVDQDGVIRNAGSKAYNGKPWSQFVSDYKITQDEINKAQAYAKANQSASTPATGTTTGSTATTTGATVTDKSKPNVSSDNIKKVQTMLKGKGYDLVVDGIWGPKTQEAYKKYKQGGSAAGSTGTEKPANDNLRTLNTAPIQRTKTNLAAPDMSNIKVGGAPSITPTQTTPEQIYSAVYDRLQGEEGGNRIKYKGDDLNPEVLQKLDMAMSDKGYTRIKSKNKGYGEKYVYQKQ